MTDFYLNCKECKHFLVCFIRLTDNRFDADFDGEIAVMFKQGKCIYKNKDLDYATLRKELSEKGVVII